MRFVGKIGSLCLYLISLFDVPIPGFCVMDNFNAVGELETRQQLPFHLALGDNDSFVEYPNTLRVKIKALTSSTLLFIIIVWLSLFNSAEANYVSSIKAESLVNPITQYEYYSNNTLEYDYPIRGEYCTPEITQFLFSQGLTFIQVCYVCNNPVYTTIYGLLNILCAFISVSLIVVFITGCCTLLFHYVKNKIFPPTPPVLRIPDHMMYGVTSAERKRWRIIHKELFQYCRDRQARIYALEAQSSLGVTLDSSYVQLICNVIMFYRSIKHDGSAINWFINIFNVIRLYYDFDDVERIMRILLTPEMTELEAQSFGTGLPALRKYVDTWKDMGESELLTKFSATIHGLVSCGIVAQLGFTFSEHGYKQLFGKGVPKFASTSINTLAYTVTEFTVSLLESGYECFCSRSLQPLLIKDRKTREWLNIYSKLIDDIIELPHNLHGEPQALIHRIKTCLADGAFLMTHQKAMVPMWQDLSRRYEKIQKEFGIAAVRKPPFSVLVAGPPGIGKSTVVGLIGSVYANTVTREGFYDLKYDPNTTVYSYSSSDDFMSGYKGDAQWNFLMDDIGREHVNHVKNGKCVALNDVITIINSIGIASNQAALEDKGRIPINPKLVTATTNTKDLNAYFGVSEPSAVLRRFPYVICPILKPEFVDPISGLMKKLDYIENDPLFYRIECVRITTLDSKIIVHYDVFLPELNKAVPQADIGDYRTECTVQELTKFLVNKIIIHENNANVMANTSSILREATMCVHNVSSLHTCVDCEDSTNKALVSQSFNFFRKKNPKRPKYISFIKKLYDYSPTYVQDRMIDWLFQHQPKKLLEIMIADTYRHVPERVIALRYAAGVAAGAAGMYGLYSMLSFMFVSNTKSESQENPVEAQTDIWSTQEKHQDFFRVPTTTKKDNDLEIVKSVSRSMFRLSVSNGNSTQNVCAITLGNSFYLTTSHAFPPSTKWQCIADYGCSAFHTSSTLGFTLTEYNLTRLPNDLIIFSSASLLPRKPISKFFPQIEDKVGRKALILCMLPGGEIEVGNVETTGVVPITYSSDNGPITGNYCDGQRIDRKPIRGDCGSVIISYSSKGYFVSGIQCAGSPISSPMNRIIISQVSQQLMDKVQNTGSLVAMASSSGSLDIHTNNRTGPLLPPHTKGIHHWIEKDSHTIVLGSFAKRSSHSSETSPSIICKDLESIFQYKNQLVSPLMSPELRDNGEWVNPFTIATNLMAQPTPHYDDEILEKASNSFVYDTTIDSSWLHDCGPVDVVTAINGVHGDSYLPSIPMSTSGGFPFPGAKRQYFHYDGEYYHPLPELLLAIEDLEASYLLGNRANVIFQGSLKDEPIKMKKRISGETRIFTACPVSFTIVVRKQYLNITKAIRMNNFITECAVGMNCYSDVWGELKDYLCAFGEDKIIAGDYKSYDKKMPANVILAAFRVLITWMKLFSKLSYADEQICIGIATDIAFPIVNMNGDLFQFFGSNPSGQPLTVIINSIVNSLYMRVAYFDIIGEVHTFRKCVRLMVLGDDNIMGSNNPSFNHTTIVAALHKRGVKYTMADKESESVPFIKIYDTDFLKRTFTQNEVRIVAPLAISSILKSLSMTVHRGNISDEETLAQSYLSARREMSLHGKENFEEFTTKMETIFDNYPSIRRFFIKKHGWNYQSTLDWTLGLNQPLEDSFYEESGVHGSDNLD